MAPQLYLISLIALLAVTCNVVVSANDNFMSCMFCELITEAFENAPTPAGVIQGMFKRCNRMGLMEPVCDQFISTNAKKILILARSGVEPADICEKIRVCEEK